MLTSMRFAVLFAVALAAAPLSALAEEASAPAAPAAAPAAPAVAPAAPVAAPEGGSTADEQFELRVKGLEEQVNDLKERIFRTKARLLLLNEKVMGGELLSGAKAVIFHRNEMGGSFELESISYQLDGAPIYTKVDVDGDLAGREEFEIFNGRIVPGRHTLTVRMVYKGSGYGMFSYLEGYKFKVSRTWEFTADAGKVTTIKAVGFEQGGITTDMKERPAIRFDVSSSKDAPANAAKPVESN